MSLINIKEKDNIMKRIFTILLTLLLVSTYSFSQNFVASTKEKSAFTDTTTTYTYQIQDTKYPVFKSKNNAFYIWKVSKKTNKKYKYYLPKEIQIQMGRKFNDKTNKK